MTEKNLIHQSAEVYSVDTVVIGAGVVGLAVARALALQGREVMVLESEYSIGMGISSRNSEVIHAGIYYPQGSLKARCCVEGKNQLYQYCDEHRVPYRRCGKLIVATSQEQLPILESLVAKAAANGVNDLQWLDGEQAGRLEPELKAEAALLSPSTGIIDSHQYMLALQGDTEQAGGMVVLNSPVLGGQVEASSDVGVPNIDLIVGGDMPCRLKARCVINSTGLLAAQLLRSIQGYPAKNIRELYWAKGHYFSLTGRAPFEHLIYPIPEPGGLGTHLTLDMGGRAKFGPDVQWVDTLNYDVPGDLEEKFRYQVATYWPGVVDRELAPAYAGIRPKLSAPGEDAEDFLIESPAHTGVSGWFNLLGIESPGLTASLAIAEKVAQAVKEYM
ncbi:FAD-dependent oxidoreductase [Hahella sp. CCB-MM4]|uniref:NAD(P)/FAD-dependent oxidoreductase n=1 Tax=Hahella sp. (strain CCB-MM4) TaxID=1926491 RepID=UPI000BCD1385|nr:NAD(P)/FAD-dependent oxidoreductase [Hahella sp. CCB-MM4]OZG71517.1 FAD-dependent oxidoreductase [Hahella sp. CCB-MM4]